MSGYRDFATFFDDFWGADTFSTAGQGSPWAIADTSAAGTPTYANITNPASGTGEIAITLASTSEVENVCLSFGDILSFDIDNIQRAVFRCRLGASALTSGTEIVWGLGSARNDTTDSVTANAWFKMVGANSTTQVYVESDDNVRDNDDVATGVTLGTTFKEFVIDFTGGKSNVRFFIDGVRVGSATTFDMSSYSSGLQPIVQIQKAANTNVDAIRIDFVAVDLKR